LPIIEKRKRVSFSTTNYSYAPLEDIVQQVQSLLSKNGFSYTFDTKEGENAIKVICYAKHTAGHSESSSLEIEIDNASKMNKTQQYGSANSYGKRYAFCNAFGILTGDEDNDARGTVDRPINRTPSVPNLSESTVQVNDTISEGARLFIQDLKDCNDQEVYTKISKELTLAHNNGKLNATEWHEITLAAKESVIRLTQPKKEEPSGTPFDDVKPAYNDTPAKAAIRAKFGK